MVVQDSSTLVTLERDARARLSHDEERDLGWLFTVAPALFDRSTSGGVFEAMRAAFVPGRTPQVQVCDAAGNVIGTEDAITARPTSEIRAAKDDQDDDGWHASRKKYGRLSRRLNAVLEQQHGEHHAKALRRYFGSEGNRWAQLAVDAGPYEMVERTVEGKRQRVAVKKHTNPYAEHRAHGRVGSLYMLTGYGLLLLKLAAARAHKKGQPVLDFTDEERLQLELCNASTSPDRAALISAMNHEARGRFALACIAWNATGQAESGA